MEDIEDNNPIKSYEVWLALNKHKLSPEMLSEMNKQTKTLDFIFDWKRYEQAVMPKMMALLEKQYPTLAPAKDFMPMVKKDIVRRIFETAEFGKRIVEANAAGEHPSEVYHGEYDQALENVYTPEYEHTLMDETNIPESWKSETPEFLKVLVDGHNEDALDAIEWLNGLNSEVIETLQEDLLLMMPELINMSADWWMMYKHLMLEQCMLWKEKNDHYSFFTDHKLGKEWMDKDYKETYKEIDRLEKEEREKNK